MLAEGVFEDKVVRGFEEDIPEGTLARTTEGDILEDRLVRVFEEDVLESFVDCPRPFTMNSPILFVDDKVDEKNDDVE